MTLCILIRLFFWFELCFIVVYRLNEFNYFDYNGSVIRSSEYFNLLIPCYFYLFFFCTFVRLKSWVYFLRRIMIVQVENYKKGFISALVYFINLIYFKYFQLFMLYRLFIAWILSAITVRKVWQQNNTWLWLCEILLQFNILVLATVCCSVCWWELKIRTIY